MSPYQELKLGYTFRDWELLKLALTHPSVAHEQGTPMQTNQRLEFLGDAVLQLVLTRELYERFPAFDEGPLTKARAKLVNRQTLFEHGLALNLGEYLLLSRGEETHGGRARPSALADAYEALVGAIFWMVVLKRRVNSSICWTLSARKLTAICRRKKIACCSTSWAS